MIYYANNHCLIIDRLFAGVRGNLTQLTVSGVGVQTKVAKDKYWSRPQLP